MIKRLILLFCLKSACASVTCTGTCSAAGSNGQCGTECSACQFDSRECIPACPTDCATADIGDGECHPLCNTADCLFDGGDCEWKQYDSGECTPELLHNAVCDSICQSAQFDFDAGDCAEFIYVNATDPSDSGSGTRTDPYRSLTKALTHPFTNPRAGVCFLPGSHLLVRSYPKLLWFTANITHLFITCRYCRDCAGNSELLIVDSQPVVLFATEAISVLVHDLLINGTQRLLRGCSSLACAFCQLWKCSADICSSEFGFVLPYAQVPPVCYGKPCFAPAEGVFVFNVSAQAVFRNLTFTAIGGVKSLIVVNSTSAFISDITAQDVEIAGPAVFIAGQKPGLEDIYLLKSTSLTSTIRVSPLTTTLTAQVDSLTVKNVNRFISPRGSLCLKFRTVPGALLVMNVHSAHVSNVFVDRLYDISEAKKNDMWKSVVSLYKVESAVVRSSTLQRVLSYHCGFLFAYLPTNLRNPADRNIDAEALTVQDSLFLAGSAIAVVAAEFNPNARFENVTVLDTLGSAFLLQYHPNAPECTSYSIAEQSVLYPPKASIVNGLKVIGSSPVSTPSVGIENACNVEVQESEVRKIAEDMSALIEAELSYLQLTLGELYANIPGKLNEFLYYCTSGILATFWSEKVALTTLQLTDNVCWNASILQVQESSNTSVANSSLCNNTSSSALEISGGWATLSGVSFFRNTVQVGTLSLLQVAVEVTNCTFLGNQAKSAAAMLADSAVVAMINSRVEGGGAIRGGAIVLVSSTRKAVLTLSDSAILNTFSQVGSGLLVSDPLALGVNMSISRSTFEGGSCSSAVLIESGTRLISARFADVVFRGLCAKDFLGVITLQFAVGELLFESVKWEHCTNSDSGIGSVLYIDIAAVTSPASVSLINCTFMHNSAAQILSLPNEHSLQQLVVTDCGFLSNNGELFDLVYAAVEVHHCRFSSNDSGGTAIARMLFGSTLLLADSEVVTTRNATGLLSVGERSQLSILHCRIMHNLVSWALVSTANGAVAALNLSIADNTVTQGPLFLVQTSVVSLSELILSENFPSDFLLELQVSTLAAMGVAVHDETADCILLRQSSAKLSAFGAWNVHGSFLTAVESTLEVVEFLGSAVLGNSVFDLAASTFAGEKLRLQNCSRGFTLEDSVALISSSWFEGQSAPFSVLGSRLSLSNCQFLLSRGSIAGDHATVVLIASRIERNSGESAVRLVNSNLYANQAVLSANSAEEGAALHLQCPVKSCNYTLIRTVFQHNSAVRGAAVFFTDVRPMLESTEMTGNKADYGNEVGTVALLLANLSEFPQAASGAVYNMPVLELRDELGQVMTADNSSSVQVSVQDGIVLQGNSRVTAQMGRFRFTGLTFTTLPGSTICLTLESQLVPAIHVTINFRLCEAGEVQEPDHSCHKCEPMTYSLELKDKDCKQCPVGALCFGGADIYPLPGYWRSSNTSEVFYECGKPCLGSPSRRSPIGECAQGYYSNLCGACKAQHFHFAGILCKLCPKRSVNIIVSLILFLVYLAFLAKIVAGSISRAEKSKTSLHLKLMMNYLQVTMMLGEFNLQWPDLLLKVFHSSSIAGNSSQAMFAIDCFSDLSIGSFVYTKHIVVTLMPVFQILLSCVLWATVSICRRSRRYFRDHNISTIMTLLLLMHSTLTSSVLSLFACRTLDNGTWLLEDLSVQCWQRQHAFFALALGVPSLIIWVLGFPLTVLAVLLMSRLDSPQTKLRFGFLYSGYEKRFFYWESVVIVRKVAVKAVSVVLNHSKDLQRVMAANTVIVTMLSLQVAYHPYDDERVNSIEALSMAANFVTLTLGAFFTADTGFAAQQILIWCIVSVNLVFLLYWARSLAVASGICWRLRRRALVAPTELDPPSMCKQGEDASLSPI